MRLEAVRTMDKPDYKDKSFAKYGSIEEVTADEHKVAINAKVDEVFKKNPHVKLKGNDWISEQISRNKRSNSTKI